MSVFKNKTIIVIWNLYYVRFLRLYTRYQSSTSVITLYFYFKGFKDVLPDNNVVRIRVLKLLCHQYSARTPVTRTALARRVRNRTIIIVLYSEWRLLYWFYDDVFLKKLHIDKHRVNRQNTLSYIPI